MRVLSLARDLRRRKARERRSLFVVEGVRCVEELVRSPLTIRGALIAPQLHDAPRGTALGDALRRRGVTVEEVDHREFASAAGTESPQGVLAIAEVPERSLDRIPDSDAPIVILDAVQDPGNAGTILRTAAALGARATIALPGTVDLWNAKVVRSAVGAHFCSYAFDATWPDVSSYLRAGETGTGTGTELWVAAADGDDVSSVAPARRVAIVLGNEGAGVSRDIAAGATRRVCIPISSAVESLNVAVAAGILLFHLRAH